MSEFNTGFIPSPEDKRDFIASAIVPQDLPIPAKFSWINPFTLNQGNFPTCVGFSSSGVKNVQEIVEGTITSPDRVSPLFIYTMCKKLDGIPKVEGTFPRVAMQVLKDYGACKEKTLPYSKLGSIHALPQITDVILEEAKKYTIQTYVSVTLDAESVKRALLISPLLVGVYVDRNFQRSTNGFVTKPGTVIGGHGIEFFAYDDEMTHMYPDGKVKKGFFLFNNSWGTFWGHGGIGYIAYEDVINSGEFVLEAWGCVDSLVNPPKPVEPEPVKPEPIEPVVTNKFYKVQVGAFSVKENAVRMVKTLKSEGFPTYLPPISAAGLYRVQVGAFLVEANAINRKRELIDAGHSDAFIVYV